MAVYWTIKTGEKIDIDKMDINHLRNALKMIVRRATDEIEKRKHIEAANKFMLHGDMAQQFNETQYEDEDDYCGEEWPGLHQEF